MANILNLKINERSNVERPNLRVTYNRKLKLRRKSVEIYSYERANMRIDNIASSAEYRMDKQFQNLLIFGISIVFQVQKILKIC